MQLTNDRLESFFKELQFCLDIAREAREPLLRAVAPAFSVFDYIKPDEKILSEILADLLDPNGTHGQGTTFLTCFLQRLSKACTLPPDWPTRAEKAKVVKEASTSFSLNNRRRIDIRIELPPRFGIGIENKPWAAEQPGQLADYRADLDRRYQGQFVLIFLSRQNRRPVSISAAEWEKLQGNGQGAIFEYSKDFLAWLSECHQKSQADRVRHFLSDFASYVRSHLGAVELKEEEPDVQQ